MRNKTYYIIEFKWFELTNGHAPEFEHETENETKSVTAHARV